LREVSATAYSTVFGEIIVSRSFLRGCLSALASIALAAGLISLPGAALGDDSKLMEDATGTESSLESEGAEEPAETPIVKGDSVTYTGTVVHLSIDGADTDRATQIVRVDGYGLLSVDFAGVPDAADLDLSKAITFSVAVPAGVELAKDDPRADFLALSESIDSNGALVALDARQASVLKHAAMGNVSPVTSAVHKIYAVMAAPRYHYSGNPIGNAWVNGPTSTSETVSDVQDAIAYADGYWSKQTSGKVRFALEGSVVPFARDTSYDCSTNDLAGDGFASFANRQAARAGYTFEPNTKLVIIFPPDTNCRGIGGLGTVNWSVNEAGFLWSIGAAGNRGKLVVTHELGHNLSFGHSNWLDCTMSNPVYTIQGLHPAGCDHRAYGDLVDVMSRGESNKLPGATTSAHLIRGGYWTLGKEYTVAKQGTTTHTLNSLSGYSGQRAVIVTDNYGHDFYVEYRDYTGDDAGFTPVASSESGAVAVGTPGVRIISLTNEASFGYPYYYQKGAPGDDARLHGRTVGSVKRADYKVGESFTNGGVTVTVQSISGSKAVVKITRAKHSVAIGSVAIVPVMPEFADPRVGGVMQASLGETWRADSYSFQWYRSARSGNSCNSKLTAISGATKQSYTLTYADYWKCLRVKVTGKISGQTSKSVTSPFAAGAEYYGIVDSAGKVEIIQAGRSNLHAKVGGWTNFNPPLTYQWYRNGAAIKGATKSTYTPVTADRGKNLHVKASFKMSGYTLSGVGTSSATSAAAVYSVAASATPQIAGVVRVGEVLSINMPDYTQGAGGEAVTPVFSYQWYRDGKAISKATKATYTLTATDHGKRITVKVTAKYAPLLALSQTSARTAKVATGQFAGTRDLPTVTKSTAPSRTLKAALPAGAITTPSVKVTWQWYRDGKAISKATKTTYTTTSADYGKAITVRATITKSKFATLRLTSAVDVTRDSVILDAWDRAIEGTLKVGNELRLNERGYRNLDEGEYTEKFQWYRDGKAISGATAEKYTPVTADIGKKLTVRIAYSKSGYLGSNRTSVATPRVGAEAFAGGPELNVQRENALPLSADVSSGKLVVHAPEKGSSVGQDGVADLEAKRTYQWYRGGVAISKATKSTYTPVAADAGKLISVRISITKSGYSEVTRFSISRYYSVIATKPKIAGTAKVGQTLTAVITPGKVQTLADPAVYSSDDIVASYQWYRDGKAISGARGATYKLKSADKGKAITVRVTQSQPGGQVASVLTSSKTKKVS
jgi:hypothetical protein